MDLSKKRKTDENGGGAFPPLPDSAVQTLSLTLQDVRKILEPFAKEQLIDILQTAVVQNPTLLSSVRSIADADPTQRKLFIRGLGWETTTEKLRAIFSSFGELDEAIVITDKATGKSKGYGFVTFKHIDGAVLALKEPNKKIDGRMAVAQLASARGESNGGGGVDVSMRKIYVGNIPFEISSERLLGHFASYGDVEEGPLGFDKQSGKQKGFAFFVYKTEEGARASLVDPVKNIDGHQVLCKLATDGKKGGKPPQGGPTGMGGDAGGPMPPPGGMNMNSNYGGFGSYGGFSSGPPAQPHQNPHLNSPLPSAIGGGQGFGNQAPQSFGGTGGGFGGSAGGYGAGGYGGGSQYGSGSGVGEYGGLNNPASSMYRMPPTSGGHPDGGNYGLSSSAYPTQLHQPPSGPRGPPGGMYQGLPPYY